MRTAVFLGLASLLLLFSRCQREPATPEALHATHCGSCHVAPSPATLPKSVWQTSVLPEMAARLGIATMGYDPEIILGAKEYALARAHGSYPETAALDYGDWERLRDYIIAAAADSLTASPLHSLTDLKQFTPISGTTEDRSGSLVTFIGTDAAGRLISGDGYGTLQCADTTLARARAPIVHYQAQSTGDLYLEIGNIYPTEAANGRLLRIRQDGSTEVLADSLHRPVHFVAADLDGNGRQEIVVSEYGNYTGVLSLLRQDDGGTYRRSRLLGAAGCVRTVVEDMTGDGRPDLVVLHAQGDEGIDLLEQRADGGFTHHSLLRFPPVWGTSWFELTDFDGDGDLDLLTVHGDNADYSNLIKPYHGLRVWLNDGANNFTLGHFAALPGATRVVARDFDADGDMDVAVACNFADFARQPEAAFVYFENLGLLNDPFAFTARSTPLATDGRWLIMEGLDVDADGDEDLVLGSFTLNPAPVPERYAERWRSDSLDYLLLRNLGK